LFNYRNVAIKPFATDPLTSTTCGNVVATAWATAPEQRSICLYDMAKRHLWASSPLGFTGTFIAIEPERVQEI